MTRRAAAIDIGSNTILLLAGERATHAETVRFLRDEIRFPRLSEGVDASGHLSHASMERALAVLREYATILRELGITSISAVATSAVRDASNGREFCARAKEETNLDIEIIPGTREAQLAFSAAVDSAAAGPCLVIDVGGGSTEFISGERGKIEHAVSLNIGAVRLTERYFKTDPPSDAERVALDQSLVEILTRELSSFGVQRNLIGIAGTATTIAAMIHGLATYDSEVVHGTIISHDMLDRWIASLSAMRSVERAAIPGLHPKRADVIVAGALILRSAMKHFSASTLRVADRGIRHALLAQLLR